VKIGQPARWVVLTLAAVTGLGMLACSSGEDIATEQAEGSDDTCQAMFVQSSQAMAFDGSQLTLEEANPAIIYFCDRPVREAGHLTWDAFMALGSTTDDSFAVNEPNAAVSVFAADGSVIEAVVTLKSKPWMSGGRAVFPVALLEGELPDVGGATVLFIDPIGRPASPTSVAGAHRRHHRRAVRRR
jgi:hypothetical protein